MLKRGIESRDVSSARFSVHGILNPQYTGFVDLHTHLSGDTADTPEAILLAAAKSGLTGLAITDHDSTRKLPYYHELNQRLGLDLEIYPGVESTALMPDKKGKYNKKKPRHVLVLFDSKRLVEGTVPDVPCYMPANELNEFVHENGGKTSVAHPFMGDFSVKVAELREIQNGSDPRQHFDYIEGHHGGVVNLIRFRKQNPLLAQTLLAIGLLPYVIDTNVVIREALRRHNGSLNIKGMTAGSDAHSVEHIGDVGVAYSREQGLFSAIESGNYALTQQNQMRPPWTMREVVRGTIGGWRMEADRRRGRNGFVVYTAKPVKS